MKGATDTHVNREAESGTRCLVLKVDRDAALRRRWPARFCHGLVSLRFIHGRLP